MKIVPELFRDGVAYYKIGIGLLDLADMKYEQLDLFDKPNGKPKLMQAIDLLNSRYRRDTVFVSAQGTQVKWEMRRAFLTPQYTTDWKSIPEIRC